MVKVDAFDTSCLARGSERERGWEREEMWISRLYTRKSNARKKPFFLFSSKESLFVILHLLRVFFFFILYKYFFFGLKNKRLPTHHILKYVSPLPSPLSPRQPASSHHPWKRKKIERTSKNSSYEILDPPLNSTSICSGWYKERDQFQIYF